MPSTRKTRRARPRGASGRSRLRDLEEHPHNLWGLFGARRALEMMGETDPGINQDLDEIMNHADVWLLDTKF